MHVCISRSHSAKYFQRFQHMLAFSKPAAALFLEVTHAEFSEENWCILLGLIKKKFNCL